jgi:hypothetical protein
MFSTTNDRRRWKWTLGTEWGYGPNCATWPTKRPSKLQASDTDLHLQDFVSRTDQELIVDGFVRNATAHATAHATGNSGERILSTQRG